ncbi:MAG: Dihydropteroate synthase [Phycisphaerae bacterium]|nr:Dihydropteroate synthase [Phycisphaerae bacterium]
MTDGISTRVWKCAHGRELDLAARPLVMGILNVTPDSFSDGGLYHDAESAVRHGLLLARAGADIIDVGGESTRPGSQAVEPDEQARRTLPVIEQLARQCEAAISIDTRSADVARQALDAGAHIVNDISALTGDAKMAATVARRSAGVVLMHMRGTPADMQDDPRYDDVTTEIGDYLAARAEAAFAAGIPRGAVVVDPGIGFGKTTEHNLLLLANLPRLIARTGGLPVLIGPSRKRFIGDLLNVPANERLAGSLASAVCAALAGASVLRMHDPGPVRQALEVAWQISRRRGGP